MTRDRLRRKRAGSAVKVHKIENFAGIHTKDKKRLSLQSKRAKMQNIGIVWECSVLCLSRCGPRIYAGPL